jgi:thiol-disulfide isomerase/thioredoxin
MKIPFTMKSSVSMVLCFLAGGSLMLSIPAGCSRKVSTAPLKSEAGNPSEEVSVVLGKRSWKQWKAQTDWDSYSGSSLKPEKAKVSKISRLAKSRKAVFIVFGGSWCKDSEAQVPLIMRLFEVAGISSKKIELYGVDWEFREPTGIAESYDVSETPTLVVLSGKEVLGRVTRSPEVSWEDDILTILSGD